MKNTFITFLAEKEQKTDIAIFLLTAILIAVLMRIFYPFPFTYSDTGAYLLQAYDGTFNVYRPSGFSVYLRLLHGISSSVYFVFYATYFLMVCSLFCISFSAKYLFNIKNKVVFIITLLLLLTNTRLIASTNLMMSDGLFTALSILYFTTQLWLLRKQSYIFAVLNLLLLFLMCKVRYSGLFFVPISVLVLALSFKKSKTYIHCAMLSLPIIIAAMFYVTTKSEYKSHTHVDTFSGFGGWQLINNASVLFPEAKAIPLSKFKTKQLKSLHQFMCSCPDDIFQDKYTMSTKYMWSNELPYKIYNSYLFHNSKMPYGNRWAQTGKLYGDYAKILIKEYPIKYFNKFIIPSITSNFKFRIFEENNIEFHNEKMWEEFYGIKVDSYKHECDFFNKIEPSRKIGQTILWIIFLSGVILYIIQLLNSKKFDEVSIQNLILLLAIICVLLGQSLSSPNTTWRYTMPIFAPMTIFLLSTYDKFFNELRRILAK